MEPLPEPTSTVGSPPFTRQDWTQTPPAVQVSVHTLHDELQHLRGELGHLQERVETLEARLHHNSTPSSRPPSSDPPSSKPRRRPGAKTARKGGGTPGHPGHRQVLFTPTTVEDVLPASCACGSGAFARVRPYSTHQGIELPPIEMAVTHWVLHQGRCVACGRWHKAQAPGEQVTGYGPRWRALMAELAGTYGNGRRMVQTFCASVLGVPISLGGIQKVLDRVTRAIAPHDTLIATQARHAPVTYSDETPWYGEHALAWLWVMANEQVAFSMIHARRSKEAFFDRIDDWTGLLVSDGYGVYQRWVNARQTCLAHLIRTARGLAAMEEVLERAWAVAKVPLDTKTLVISPRLWSPGRQRQELDAIQATASAVMTAARSEVLALEDLTWKQLEELVAYILSERGLKIHLVTESPQGGRDIIARGELIPGFEPLTVAVEVKHRSVVNRPEVQKALWQNRQLPALLYVTSGRFSAGVTDERNLSENRLRLHLWDGITLLRLIEAMI